MLVQYATAKIGAILVNINPAYRTHELEYVLNQAGDPVLVAARELQDVGLRGDDRRGRPSCPALRQVVLHRHPRLGRAAGAGRLADATGCAGGGSAVARTTRSTSSTRPARPASPRAPRCRTTTSSTTAIFVGELCGYTEADRVCIPVPFYHCFGMVMGNLACYHRTAPPWSSRRPAFDAKATLRGGRQAERCTSLYGVPTMFIAELSRPGLRRPTTCPACGPGSWPARRARSR